MARSYKRNIQNYKKKCDEQEKKQEELKEKQRKRLLCYGCVWGRWTGVSYTCMFPKHCIYGGAKNEPT